MNRELEILLVEDNPADAELTLRALRRHHLANRLTHVVDGQAALDFFFGPAAAARGDGGMPVLVLLDLKLPKVNGKEVLRQLRADPRTGGVPVIVLTSSSADQDVLETYHLGASSYIVKPVEFENFSEAVNQLGCDWLLLAGRPGAAEDKPAEQTP